MKTKMKKGSHRHDISQFRPRYERKCTKYKRHLSMMMLVCIKQHLSNT